MGYHKNRKVTVRIRQKNPLLPTTFGGNICLAVHHWYEYQTKTMMTHQIGWQLITETLPLYANTINLSCMKVPTG